MALAGYACSFDLGGPNAPGLPPPPSSDEENLETLWDSLSGLGGEITLIVNESQLTAFIADRLSQQEDPVLREPRVLLRDGEIRVHGTTDQGPFQASVLLVIEPTVDDQGELSLKVTSAELGPFPLPAFITDSLSALISEAFAGGIGSYATGVQLTTIAIADGEMAVRGVLR
jgi:hypothetical protein